MRNFLVLLLLCGLAFLGYQTIGTTWAAPPEQGDAGPGEGPDGTSTKLVQNDGATAPNGDLHPKVQPVVHVGQTPPNGARERYTGAVAAAAGGDNAALTAATAAFCRGNAADLGDVLAAGVARLAEAGRLSDAIVAAGDDNRLLRATGLAVVQESLLRAMERASPTERAELLSSWVDLITRGPVRVWRANYPVLKQAYIALQRALEGVLFDRNGTWRSRLHRVRPGESLARIAIDFEKETGLPMAAGLLRRINGIQDPKLLQAGVRLRIPTDRIHVIVEKSTYSLKVYLGSLVVRLYQVGLGKDGRTPEVEFSLSEKQNKPDWTEPRTGELIPYGDPRHLIGDYFLKLSHPVHDGFGLHGTADKGSIGQDSSMGCIRLRATDMAAVFDYLPRRAKLVVRP